MEKEDLNNILIKLKDSIDEEQDKKVYRYSEQYLNKQKDPEVLKCRTIAQIRMERYKQVTKDLSSNTDPDSILLLSYSYYKQANYLECLKTIDSLSQKSADHYLLKSQALNKLERFLESCDVLAPLLQGKEEGVEDYKEEICTNFFNSLSLGIWAAFNQKRLDKTKLSKKVEEAFSIAVDFCTNNIERITIREVLLNLGILLAINVITKFNLFEQDKELPKRVLSILFERLEKDKEAEEAENIDKMEEEDAELTDIQKDILMARVIEAIFQSRDSGVRFVDERVEYIEDSFSKLGGSDAFLKASILSYLIYLTQSGAKIGMDIYLLTKELDNLEKNLQQEKIGPRLEALCLRNIRFNRAITLLIRGKHENIKSIGQLSVDKVECDLISHFVAMKTKDYSKLDKLAQKLEGNDKKIKLSVYIMQLAVYHQMNNQQKYVSLFKSFMDVNFILKRKLY